MKKDILLLLSIGTLTSVFAQDGRYHDDRNNTRDVVPGRDDHQTVYNNPVRDDHRNVPYVDYRKRDEEIARVSNDYDRRIDAVRWDWHWRGRDKAREMSRLQHEKEQAICDINERYERMKADHNRY